jgi:hypothetical protein
MKSNKFDESTITNFLNENDKVYKENNRFWFTHGSNDDLSKNDIIYIVKSRLNIDCEDDKVEEVVNKWVASKEK